MCLTASDSISAVVAILHAWLSDTTFIVVLLISDDRLAAVGSYGVPGSLPGVAIRVRSMRKKQLDPMGPVQAQCITR